MSFVSYAQNFEDVLLWRALGDVGRGQYIDIGAQDPVVDSVSLAFYQAGWRGIHVEPTPSFAARLREARPDETVIEAAVTDAPGPITFFEIPETGLSTGKTKIAAYHRKLGYEARKAVVPSVRLDQLLGMTKGDTHWLKIDVEGMEADVLRSWGESPHRPWVLVIEATYPSTQKPNHRPWLDEVLRRGYREVHFDGLSRFFLHQTHEPLAKHFASPPNVFDRFVIAPAHFAGAQAAQRETALSQAIDQVRGEAVAAAHDAWSARVGLEAAERNHQAALAESDRLRADASVAIERHLNAEREHREAVERLYKESLDTVERLFAEHQRQESALRDEHDQALREARCEADRYRVATEQADGVIKAALSERPGRWQKIGKALGFRHSDQARRALLGWSWPAADQPTTASTTTHLAQENKPAMPSPSLPTARNPYLRADSLSELLSWHDVDFVRCAYVTVLGRQPDPEGERHYTDRLRRGYSKYGILWQLRTSREGPRHDPGIAGFDRTIRKHHHAQLPIVGWLFGWFSSRETDSRRQRQFRALENMIGALPTRLSHGGASSDLGAAIGQLQQSVRDLTYKVEHGLPMAAGGGGRPEDRAVRHGLSPASRKFFDRLCA